METSLSLAEQEIEQEKTKKEIFVKEVLINSIGKISGRNGQDTDVFLKAIEEVWGDIYRVHAGRPMFNLYYINDCLISYLNQCSRLQLTYDPSITLAIIFQRIGGRMSIFQKNAERAFSILSEKFKLNIEICISVKEYILSSVDLFHGQSNYKNRLLRDVYLCHLGGTYFEFCSIQEKIYKERTILTRLEHYKCTKEIFTKLRDTPKIYAGAYFIEKYELNTKRNIQDYLLEIDRKIKELETSDPKSVKPIIVKSKELDPVEVMEGEGYCG